MPMKTVFETALTDVWATADAAKVGDKAGDIRWERDADGMKCYKCVVLDLNATTPIIGMAAMYTDGASDVGYATHEVTMDFASADAVEVGAGIFISIPTTDGDRFWLQIKGYSDVVTAAFDSTVVDGSALTCADAAVDGEMSLPNTDSEVVIGFCVHDVDLKMYCDFPY